MDVLVLLEEATAHPDASIVLSAPPAPLAHVTTVPAAAQHDGSGHEVVTLYGAADARTLALALAAVVEGRGAVAGVAPGAARRDVVRHLGVWESAGALGDAAWRDRATGEMKSTDLAITADALAATADRLLGAHGAEIRRMAAQLATPDWPEGTRRALRASLDADEPAADADDESLLAILREADGYDDSGD